uniref:Uncharacterized protein n=1 Tax=Nelumbo nucifera TaxID=4432 RepID=A0A822XNG7_NELNU|nr:TPA_asm: hypothetical protein HUJ06_023413 [Nelumbo nucifera]
MELVGTASATKKLQPPLRTAIGGGK